MKAILEGTYNCPTHGEFVWKTMVISGHMEHVFGWWDRMCKNVKRTVRMSDKFMVTVECPHCGKRFVVECDYRMSDKKAGG